MPMMCKRYYNFESCVLLRSSPIFETLPHQMPEFAIKSLQPKRYKQPTKSVEPFLNQRLRLDRGSWVQVHDSCRWSTRRMTPLPLRHCRKKASWPPWCFSQKSEVWKLEYCMVDSHMTYWCMAIILYTYMYTLSFSTPQICRVWIETSVLPMTEGGNPGFSEQSRVGRKNPGFPLLAKKSGRCSSWNLAYRTIGRSLSSNIKKNRNKIVSDRK